jgi:type IV pilus assembly protein PilY1
MVTPHSGSQHQNPLLRCKAFAIGLLLSIVTGTPVMADDTDIFFSASSSASSIKPNVLFILDTSGSMDWTDGQPQSRLERMKEALNAILNNATNINVSLMRFNGSNGGGAVLFPMAYIDQDVCDIEDCSTSDQSVLVRVSQDSDDAEESTEDGSVRLDNEEMHVVEDSALSGATTTTIEISSSVNDAEERHDNTLHHDSPDLDLFYSSGGNHLGVGIRFQNVGIPQGATITNADIVFTVDDRGRGDLNIDIYGNDTDDALPWNDSAGQRVTDRTQTDAKVDWDDIENRRGDRTITTPELKEIVQEIVNRGGWTDSSDLAFMMFVDGNSNRRNYRDFYSYNGGGSSKGPKLRVTYVSSAGSADTTQTVGLRFDNVDIPQGASINSAYLEFEASEVATDTANLTITGELETDPATFTDADHHVSSRLSTSPTTNTVAWSGVEAWDSIGTKYLSPDISDIVQELVDQTDFCGGNAMAFFLTGTGNRLAVAHEGSGDAPTLRVTYDTSGLASGEGCMKKTITQTISRDSDDAEEDTGNGSVSTGNRDLELINDGNDQIVGLRFQELDIAQGADISEASIEFEVDEDGTGSINLTITGQDIDDAPTFSASTDNLSDRTETDTSVAWNIASDNNPPINSALTTPDVSSIIEEIVGRGGWAPGNDMVFLIKKSSGSGKRVVESRDGETSGAARLTLQVQWNEGDVTAAVQTVRNRLIDEVSAIDAEGGTPIVDAMYEGALYYRGEAVDYGKQRGDNPTGYRSDAEVHRVSHPGSYTGGTVVRDANCTDDNLSNTACRSEHIEGSPVYTSPITDACQTSHIVLLSDGEPTSNSSASKVRTMTGDSSCTDSGDKECGVELSQFLSDEDQADFTGDQTVKTYTIGFALDSGSDSDAIDFLRSLATDGSNGFYEASSSADLVNAFDDIITDIISTTSTFVAPGAAVNQFNRLIHDDEIYFSLFKPDSRPYWNGNLKKYQITNDGIKDQNGNLAVDDNTGMFKGTSQSYWSDSADGNEVSEGGAAGERSLTRDVYTYLTGSSSTVLSHSDNEFSEDNTDITTAKLGLDDTQTTERENILKWARGVDLKDVDEDGDTSEVRLEYGDPLHSKPVIITYGGTEANPDNTIFFGSNEGFIHAIKSSDGTEEFSFIPEELLPNLEDLYVNSSSSAHPYGMDGTVVVWAYDDNGDNDYYDTTGGDNDHVYLYAGMRRGGRSYYALDVTDRDNPEYMWKITGGTGDYTELAESWSIPVRAKVYLNGTAYDVLVIGGGYDNNQDTHTTRTADNEGRSIFMINALNGNVVWQGAKSGVTGTNEAFTDMDYSFPGEVRVIDINLDGYADMMFAADMGGQVWRFDISNGATDADDLVSGGVIADFGADSDAANNRRFYTTPDVALVKEGSSKFLTIAIGSGWRAKPTSTVVTNRFYVFRDSYWGQAPGSYTTLGEGNLVDVTNNLDATAIASAFTNDGKKGWYITMENTGEKVLASSVTVNNQVIFSTYSPETSSTSCAAAQGTGRTYAVSVLNGRPVVNFDLLVNADPNNLTKEDRVITLQRSGIPPEATVLFAPDPVVLIGPEMPLNDLPFGDIAQRTYWYQEEE